MKNTSKVSIVEVVITRARKQHVWLKPLACLWSYPQIWFCRQYSVEDWNHSGWNPRQMDHILYLLAWFLSELLTGKQTSLKLNLKTFWRHHKFILKAVQCINTTVTHYNYAVPKGDILCIVIRARNILQSPLSCIPHGSTLPDSLCFEIPEGYILFLLVPLESSWLPILI